MKKERSGVHKFLRTTRKRDARGKIPPDADRLVVFVEKLIARIAKKRGVNMANLSADEQRILNDIRRGLISIGLIERFRYRGHSIVSNDERLLDWLHVVVRENFCKLGRNHRMDLIRVAFFAYLSASVPLVLG